MGGKGIHRLAPVSGNGAKGGPEAVFQRDAGAMAVQGERMFDGAGCHACHSSARAERRKVRLGKNWPVLRRMRAKGNPLGLAGLVEGIIGKEPPCCRLPPIVCNCAMA